MQGEMAQEIKRGGWSSALIVVAIIHLLAFIFCHVLYDPAVVSDYRHLLLWIAELGMILIALQAMIGRGWMCRSPAIGLVVKLWTTFLILSFNVVTLNAVTGFELSWFKPVWATLSTFLLASLAWLFTPWLLLPAVQMYFTGLLMVKYPHSSYLTYGLSWWLALTGMALWIGRGKDSRDGRRDDRASSRRSIRQPDRSRRYACTGRG